MSTETTFNLTNVMSPNSGGGEPDQYLVSATKEGETITILDNNANETTIQELPSTTGVTGGKVLTVNIMQEAIWTNPWPSGGANGKILAWNTAGSCWGWVTDDSVKTTGNQTINGTKTFASMVYAPSVKCAKDDTHYVVYGKDTDGHCSVYDVDGDSRQEIIEMGTDDTYEFCGRSLSANSLATARYFAVNLENSSVTTWFNGSANADNVPVYGTLPVAHGGTGQTSLADLRSAMSVPTTTAMNNAISTACAGFASDDNVVHKTTTETVGGNKTFTGWNKTYNGTGGNACYDFDAGENGAFMVGTNGTTKGIYLYQHGTDNGKWMLYANTNNECFFNGNSASASSAQVGSTLATTLAGKANSSDVVKLTTNQSVAGTKTFTNNPKVAPTSGGGNVNITNATGTKKLELFVDAFNGSSTTNMGLRWNNGTTNADILWCNASAGTPTWSFYGNATTATTATKATQLNTARKLKVNLASTTDVTFNGTADVTSIPVTGTLADSHIASADTWNAKQNALPTSAGAYDISINGTSGGLQAKIMVQADLNTYKTAVYAGMWGNVNGITLSNLPSGVSSMLCILHVTMRGNDAWQTCVNSRSGDIWTRAYDAVFENWTAWKKMYHVETTTLQTSINFNSLLTEGRGTLKSGGTITNGPAGLTASFDNQLWYKVEEFGGVVLQTCYFVATSWSDKPMMYTRSYSAGTWTPWRSNYINA